MDPVHNPFAPGAGSPPPELAGRKHILEDAEVAIQRALLGKSFRSQILLGLRGVGKTVLLNKIQDIAEAHKHLVSFIEAPEGKLLAEQLYPQLSKVLRKLQATEAAKARVHSAMRALRSFASVFKIEMGDFSVSVEPEAGAADSGDLESDLTDLFVRVGEAAKAAGSAWTLLIDEVQYLKEPELAALIVALHKTSQKQLPVLFFGAGLPQIAAMSGEAKSYAERLFTYPSVGALSEEDARSAIVQPLKEEGAQIDEDALCEITAKTKGYPYFLQEWGYQSWNAAQGPNITFDRLTPKERSYVFAMAQLGPGPYRSSEVAEKLGEDPKSLGPCRSQIINKGMIYSPSHGDIAFTVPMFDEYLIRTQTS